MSNKSQLPTPEKPEMVSSSKGRKIDVAMAEERLAKSTVRQFWLEQALFFDREYPDDDVPLYLTLSGAEGRDIKLLAENDVIELTEIGGIAAESQQRVVAIEMNPQAVLSLQKELPGLQIIEQNFANMIAGESLLSFPTNQRDINGCCAKIINLDLQGPLNCRNEKGGLVFPLFNWIEKVSRLHAAKKAEEDWCLCLTLNSSINQPDLLGVYIQDFLKENYRSSLTFKDSCGDLLGDMIQDAILSDTPLDLTQLSAEEKQKILMIFVPKKISRIVHGHNWHVKTLQNYYYGGTEGQAPMVTWVLFFEWDQRAAAAPETVYIESLDRILSSAGQILDDGQILNYR